MELTSQERAFERAIEWAKEHGEPEYFVDEGAVILRLPSRTRTHLNHVTSYGGVHNRKFCTCEAFKEDKPCWHLALAEMVSNGSEPWNNKVPSYIHDVDITFI